MARFAQAVVLGLLQGGLYGLVGVGFSLVWGVTNVVNVAHGAFVVVGAYIAWELQATFGVDPLLGMVVSAGALFVAGYALQRGLVNLVVNAPIWMTLILTFGLELAIVNGLVYTLSGDLRAIPTSWARDGFTLAGAAFAVAAGIPVLRLRGHYFAIATLGIAEGMREVVINRP